MIPTSVPSAATTGANRRCSACRRSNASRGVTLSGRPSCSRKARTRFCTIAGSSGPPRAPRKTGLSDPTASRGGRLALVYLGAYVLAAVAVLLAVAVFRFSWVFALIAAGWMLRSIHGKKGRVQMAALADQLDRQGVFQALKSR